MGSFTTACIVTVTLVIAYLLGRWLRPLLSADQLSADSKDAVKLAMGLVATMSALLLGLLVSSAKSNYDATRGQVIQMAAKITFLDRVLSLYGPEADSARHAFRDVVVDAARRIWPEDSVATADLAPNVQAGDAFFKEMQALEPKNDGQRALKAQAMSIAVELGELRMLLQAQSIPSVSTMMLVVVVCWLVVIFFASSLLAPPNAMTGLALVAAAGSVAGALFLILELDTPFAGMLHLPSAPILAALSHIAR
jgi:hypothetical protein